MYTREIRKYKETGSALDASGKLVNASVLHIGKRTLKNLPSLCRKETDDTSNTHTSKSNATNRSTATSNRHRSNRKKDEKNGSTNVTC